MKIFFALVVISLIDRSIDAQLIDPPIPCKGNEDCSVLAKFQKDPTCKGGFCVCLNEQEKLTNCSSLPVGFQQEKTTMPQFYQPCKRDTECNFNNSICNTTRAQCECRKGYVPSFEKQQCLKVAQGLSFPCTENKQCSFQPNTTCVQQQCICINGFHAVENVCWKMAPFGGPCTKSEECYHINGALCTDKKICGCGNNMVIDDNKRNCVLLAKSTGDYCTNNEHCSAIQDSICVNEKCQCTEKKHFVAELKKCIVNRGIDEPCSNNYDCYQIENGTTSPNNALQCVGTLCDCREQYRRQGDKCESAAVSTSHFSLLIILSTVVCIFFLQ